MGILLALHACREGTAERHRGSAVLILHALDAKPAFGLAGGGGRNANFGIGNAGTAGAGGRDAIGCGLTAVIVEEAVHAAPVTGAVGALAGTHALDGGLAGGTLVEVFGTDGKVNRAYIAGKAGDALVQSGMADKPVRAVRVTHTTHALMGLAEAHQRRLAMGGGEALHANSGFHLARGSRFAAIIIRLTAAGGLSPNISERGIGLGIHEGIPGALPGIGDFNSGSGLGPLPAPIRQEPYVLAAILVHDAPIFARTTRDQGADQRQRAHNLSLGHPISSLFAP